MKNLVLGSCVHGYPPDDDIPSDILEDYAELSCSDPYREMFADIADRAVVTSGPDKIVHCDFVANIVGVTMICASSSIHGRIAEISDCLFYHDLIGGVELLNSA